MYIKSLTFTAHIDLMGYIFETVGSYECGELLRNAFSVIDYLIQNGQGEYLQERLNLCHPVDAVSTLDVATLLERHIFNIIDYIHEHQ